jgi:hypothetical protein
MGLSSIINEGWSRQCPWIMDLGSGERGAPDELDGLSDKQGDLTSVLRQTRVTNFVLIDPPLALPSPF